MEPQGLDRTALIGILLMSVLLGVWMITTAPSEAELLAQREAQEQNGAEADTDEPDAVLEAPEAADALEAPTDSALFGRALTGTPRDITVRTDRYTAVFSTQGGTLTSFRLLGYDRAGTDDHVDLVSNPAGALALGFTPPTGAYLDTRTLQFRPVVGGQAFALDSLRVADAPRELAFEAPVGEGALRFVYTFNPDSYDVGLRVETPGTDVLARSYSLVWDGALPRTEAAIQEEVIQAGAFGRLGGETDFVRPDEPGDAEPLTRSGRVDWVAVKTKFFLAAIIPDARTETDGYELTGSQVGEFDTPDAFAQDYEARLELGGIGAGQADAYTLYLGPMELRRLAAYGLYDTVDFGFGATMTRPIARYFIAPAFAFLSTFLPNYGLVIILFALVVKLLLWPLTAASYRNAARMRGLQPQMNALKEKYGDDPQKQQTAIMALYREAGVNPLGGCLPMLLQYPILIAMWRFFQVTLVLRGQSFLWATDLSAPDPILQLPFSIPVYGDFVAGFTLLMGASMMISMRLSMSGDMAGQQKVLLYIMPIFFLSFFNRFPSGLSLYYLAFNLFSIVQQRMINLKVEKETAAGGPKVVRQAKADARADGRARSAGKPKRPGRKRRGGFTANAVAEAKRKR